MDVPERVPLRRQALAILLGRPTSVPHPARLAFVCGAIGAAGVLVLSPALTGLQHGLKLVGSIVTGDDFAQWRAQALLDALCQVAVLPFMSAFVGLLGIAQAAAASASFEVGARLTGLRPTGLRTSFDALSRRAVVHLLLAVPVLGWLAYFPMLIAVGNRELARAHKATRLRVLAASAVLPLLTMLLVGGICGVAILALPTFIAASRWLLLTLFACTVRGLFYGEACSPSDVPFEL